MERSILTFFTDFFIAMGVSPDVASLLNGFTLAVIILLLAVIANWIAKRILISLISGVVKKSKTNWDDMLFKRKVFNRLANFAPALVIYFATSYALSEYTDLVAVLQAAVYIYVIGVGLFLIDSVLNGMHDIYLTLKISKDRPIKGFIQVAKIIIYFVGVILILSILLGKSPVVFFTGLGALAAVLLLIFKDSILGLVAGVQLTANDMVRIGDWISMPGHNADGPVTDISLNTVKVQNWDKTISTIPTYALVSESFSNWRGMTESGGRRIKRSIFIDMKSVRFLDKEMTHQLRNIRYIESYIDRKQKELKEYNDKHNIDDRILVNGRRMTNLGTFRKYIEEYLRNHPYVHTEMTFLVRHLQPTEKGLPIEIYIFSKEQAWPVYEGIQAAIFDHIIAVVPEFGLRIFQNPSGEDILNLSSNLKESTGK